MRASIFPCRKSELQSEGKIYSGARNSGVQPRPSSPAFLHDSVLGLPESWDSRNLQKQSFSPSQLFSKTTPSLRECCKSFQPEDGVAPYSNPGTQFVRERTKGEVRESIVRVPIACRGCAIRGVLHRNESRST